DCWAAPACLRGDRCCRAARGERLRSDYCPWCRARRGSASRSRSWRMMQSSILIRIWCEVSLHRRRFQQFLDPLRLVESIVDPEADIGGKFQIDAPRDFAAQEFLVALQCRDHDLGIATAERHHINGCEFQVR